MVFRAGVLCRRLPYFDRNDATKVVRTRFTRQSMESFFLLNVKASEAARRLEKIEKNRGSEPAPGGLARAAAAGARVDAVEPARAPLRLARQCAATGGAAQQPTTNITTNV